MPNVDITITDPIVIIIVVFMFIIATWLGWQMRQQQRRISHLEDDVEACHQGRMADQERMAEFRITIAELKMTVISLQNELARIKSIQMNTGDS